MFIDEYVSAVLPIRGKILLVDDQVVNIKILHQLLNDDYDIHMARDGVQAIDMCKKIQPDIILLDIEMPTLSGFDVCERLKADPLTQDVVIIFVTGHFDEEKEVKGFQLGAVDFIHKPINPVITKARIKNQFTLKCQSDLLRKIALLDGLTGVANRRKFEESYPQSWLYCVRAKQPISIIMLDIDYFKRYNDHYGHSQGDTCLRSVAQAISSRVNRPYDLVARFGGEEFICVLPDTDYDGALFVTQQIVDSIIALKIPHQGSDVMAFVTISAGLASVNPSQDMDLQTLVETADKQLYRAKENGRNRVEAINMDSIL
ncbi:diguanylate cyclase [Shewanella sp. SR44-3]|uniref:diguanylate cyclase n=1 Tax=Shewanella sp. SR44-3 TaxID=2760936 RepID=UPI0015FBCF2B|nr:diguanylate cyclase [Shewanella sp. SR44-3]MBB1267865.1 diguanylate cyclase [Shewanella sp. SR44-3]